MRILLENKSNKTVIFNIDGIEHTLFSDAGTYIETKKENFNLSVYPDEKYRRDPITGSLGLSYFHRFIVKADYNVTVNNNCTIRFYTETAHGNNFESYTRIYPFSNECVFSSAFYSVNSKNYIKDKIEKSDKNEAIILQGAGVVGKLIKVKNTFDDVVTAAVLSAVALIAFILIWIFKDFRTAAIIYLSIAVLGFLMWKLFFTKSCKKSKNQSQVQSRKSNGENVPALRKHARRNIQG